MANKSRVNGRLLTASAESRTLNYLLIPYGEQGSPSGGPLTINAGTVRIPDEPIVVNMQHDAHRPVGKTTRIEETDAGIEVSVQIANTTLGNDLLEEVAFGLRTGISCELDECVRAGGILQDSILTGAGFVTEPAFASARVMAELTETEKEAVTKIRDLLDTLDAEPEETEPVDENPFDNEKEDTNVSENASISAELITAGRKNVNADKSTLGAVVAKIAGASTGSESQITAALTDIEGGPIFDGTSQPQWLGELWSGRDYKQRFAGLVSHQSLTSPKATGWKFTETPTVAAWAGFPNEIATSDVGVELVEVSAKRLAGGWVMDRALVDFGQTEFINQFFRFATDDYARKIDNEVVTHISNSAVAITGGAPVAGISPAAAKIVDGALHLLTTQDVLADYAIIGTDLYRSLLLTPKDQVFEYLNSALGLEEGSLAGFSIIPTALPALQGKAVVGNRSASTLFELPGASPVRVSALDIARGGVENALYGYYALIHSGKGIVKVS